MQAWWVESNNRFHGRSSVRIAKTYQGSYHLGHNNMSLSVKYNDKVYNLYHQSEEDWCPLRYRAADESEIHLHNFCWSGLRNRWEENGTEIEQPEVLKRAVFVFENEETA